MERSEIVFVVDDDASMREALEQLIRSLGCDPHTFSSAADFLAYPRAAVPSCLILEVEPPGVDGLALLESAAAERVDLPVIVITSHADIPMVVRAMKAGAVEFLMKPFGDEVLIRAIRYALARSASVLRLQAESRELRNAYASLSRREQEVMGLVVAGLLNKQIGAELGISEVTVKAHRGQVMRKMKAASLADLVKEAAALGVSRQRYFDRLHEMDVKRPRWLQRDTKVQ